MKKLIALSTLSLVLFSTNVIAQTDSVKSNDLYVIDANEKISLTAKGANFIAKWNFDNFQREFPNNRLAVYMSVDDIQRPKDSNPAFYDCADWHSSVHTRWTMVKLLKLFPKMQDAKRLKEMLDKTFEPEKIKGEVNFFTKPENQNIGFEYPYGQSWLLKLAAELHSWDDPQAKQWYANLLPLTKLMENIYFNITYSQPMPDRYGHHDNTAFALLNGLDYAEEMQNDTLASIIGYKAMAFYGKDVNAPLLYEPCNSDFLAPNFLEAAVMSRVLNQDKFTLWLSRFMPHLFELEPKAAFKAQQSETNSHLKGYNLTKAYCLNTILKNINNSTTGYAAVKTASHVLVKETLPLLMDGDFDDSHWLGSFILLAITSDK